MLVSLGKVLNFTVLGLRKSLIVSKVIIKHSGSFSSPQGGLPYARGCTLPRGHELNPPRGAGYLQRSSYFFVCLDESCRDPRELLESTRCNLRNGVLQDSQRFQQQMRKERYSPVASQ